MLVIFPSDTFDTRKPDEAYAEEVEVAQQEGHQVAFMHWESLVNDDDAAKAVKECPDFENDTLAIYRGWMLTSEQYEKFYNALQVCCINLATNPDEYRNAHEFPSWYSKLMAVTPTSTWIPKEEIDRGRIFDPENKTSPRAMARTLLERCPHGIIIKDYVKSRKHEWDEACYVPNVDKLDEVLGNFIERQWDDMQGGIVFREYVPLRSIGKHPQSGMPMGEEFRIFWGKGRAMSVGEYWPTGAYVCRKEVELDGTERQTPVALDELPSPQELSHLAEAIDNPFISMDVARADDGEWFLMEVGDGQVSGLPRGRDDAELLYGRLDSIFFQGLAKDVKPVTQQELDSMTCAHEGCDHKSHSSQMVIHPRCHVGAPTWCWYDNGVINVKCSECDSLVVRIAVDPGTVTRH